MEAKVTKIARTQVPSEYLCRIFALNYCTEYFP